MVSAVLTNQETVYLKMDLGKAISLQQIGQQIIYIHKIVNLCEKLVLSDISQNVANVAVLNEVFGKYQLPERFRRNVVGSLGRDSSDILHVLRVKALAEYYKVDFPGIGPGALAEVVEEVRSVNQGQLLGVTRINYKNPLEAVIEILPSILEEAKWAAHGGAALMLAGGVLVAIRKWQKAGKQLLLRQHEIDLKEIELEIKKLELENQRVDSRLYRKRTEIKIIAVDTLAQVLQEGAEAAVGSSLEDEQADHILNSISEGINSTLMKVSESAITDTLGAIIELDEVEKVSID